jgi:hypothetical protein
MRRTKAVLAAATLMVAMLVAFAAPAMANTNERNVQNRISNDGWCDEWWCDNNNDDDCCNRWSNNDDVVFFNGEDCCEDEWFDNNDDVVILAVPVWGWGWEDGWEHGWKHGWDDCGFDPDGPVNCWD